MGPATKRLTDLVYSADRYDIPHAELLPLQLDAANERFQVKVEQIKLLRNRAEQGAITIVESAADIVPLLFAHTAYKSYPEGWLSEGKWDRLTRWLETITSSPTNGIDLADVKDI